MLHWAGFQYQRAYCMPAVGGGVLAGAPLPKTRLQHYQVWLADDAATHPGRPLGSTVQPVRGKHTTSSPSLPEVRASAA